MIKNIMAYIPHRLALTMALSCGLLLCFSQNMTYLHDPLMNAYFGATLGQPYATPNFISGWNFKPSYRNWLEHSHDTAHDRVLLKPYLMKDTEYAESTDSSVTKRAVLDGIAGTKMVKDLAVPYTSIPVAGFSQDIDRINDEIGKIEHWRNYIVFYGGSADAARHWSNIQSDLTKALAIMTSGGTLQPNYKRKEQLSKLYHEAVTYRQELVAEIHTLYNHQYFTVCEKNNKHIRRINPSTAIGRAKNRWTNAAFEASHKYILTENKEGDISNDY